MSDCHIVWMPVCQRGSRWSSLCCMANINYLCIRPIMYGQFWGHTLFKKCNILPQFEFLWLCTEVIICNSCWISRNHKSAVIALLIQLTQLLQRARICKRCSSWFKANMLYSFFIILVFSLIFKGCYSNYFYWGIMKWSIGIK